MAPLFSIIVPVYNRPQEVDELLKSLCGQSLYDFEVVIVEDGSAVPCEEVCRGYADRLNIRYFAKPNSGPGPSRNYGAARAQGEYLLILDSDVILPTDYLKNIREELQREPTDAFGGPDRANENFTPVQKAINYAMTSFFTTGGIRGGKKKMDKFYPRSFNLGVRREVFEALGGFSDMRFGEDIDFSIRIFTRSKSYMKSHNIQIHLLWIIIKIHILLHLLYFLLKFLYLLYLILKIHIISITITGIKIQNIHTILLNSNALLKSNLNKLFTALVIPT